MRKGSNGSSGQPHCAYLISNPNLSFEMCASDNLILQCYGALETLQDADKEKAREGSTTQKTEDTEPGSRVEMEKATDLTTRSGAP